MTKWLDYFSIIWQLKIAKIGLNFCQAHKNLKCLPKISESLPKWQNFAKSSHTVLKPHFVLFRAFAQLRTRARFAQLS